MAVRFPVIQPTPRLATCRFRSPIYRLVAVGGDTSLTSNVEYRVPIVNQVTFALFTDFGLVGDLAKGQLRESFAGSTAITRCAVWLPDLRQWCLFRRPVGYPSAHCPSDRLATVPHTNFVPAHVPAVPSFKVVLPIVNAPFRLYYAYNPLRLERDLPQKLAVTDAEFKSFFPDSGAGLFSYQQALQFYGADYTLREPRKTFRLSVSTTF